MKIRILASTVWVIAASFALAKDPVYHLVKELPIDGHEVNGLELDETTRRLYISQNTGILALDLQKGDIAGLITNLSNIRAFTVIPKSKTALVADSQAPALRMIDLVKLTITGREIKTDGHSHGIICNPGGAEIYALNAGGNRLTVYGIESGEFVTNIALAGKPSMAVADPKSSRIFCGIGDKDEISIVDTKTHQITGHWPVIPGKSPQGIALDSEHGRLFVGCANGMAILDTTNGRVVSAFPVAKGIRSCVFHKSARLLFAVTGNGTITVVDEKSPDEFAPAPDLDTRGRCLALALNPTSGTLYLALSSGDTVEWPSKSANRQSPNLKILIFNRMAAISHIRDPKANSYQLASALLTATAHPRSVQ